MLVCRPEGELDEATGQRIADLASSQAPRKVVLDLSETSYLSSQGISALLLLQTQLAGQKRSLALAAPSPLVRRILHQAGIAGVVPILTNMEGAGGDPPTPSSG